MFRPLALYIGLRYTRAKRRQHFISFISLASLLGIALGVAVLITVLSVMNGFDYEIKSHLFNLANQVTVTSTEGQLANWNALAQQVKQQPKVKAVAPFISVQGMLVHSGSNAPVMLLGITPDQEKHVSTLHTRLEAGSFDSLVPHQFNIVLGEALAISLGVDMGDKVVLFTPQLSTSPLGIYPRLRQFTVSGIYHVEENPNMDGGLAFMNLQDAQTLYQMGNGVTGLRLRVSDLYSAPEVAKSLQRVLSNEFLISDWTRENATFFRAMRMEKTMIFLLLLFIITVAAFNLVSSLVMAVNDKQADIAILRTFGATPSTIMGTFVVQGFVLGLVGTLLGLIGGVLLALNVSRVVNFIQELFHVQFISSSVYFINYLPSRLEWSDVWQICGIALILSLLATLYPAWVASRTQPAEALRYE
ncbi:MAG: lipoprotein-releasing ABC transporter permease subunit [Gammaproteobacteria bacterium]